LPGLVAKTWRTIGAFLVLGCVGAVANRIAAPVRTTVPANGVEFTREGAATEVGQGAVLAVLGGFRGLAADALWVHLHATWETRDLPATDSLVRLVTAVDPRPVYFWLNGARILAYDLCAWRIEAAGGYNAVAESLQRRVVTEQAEAALRYLAAGIAVHPQRADLWLERANIELNRLHDTTAAAESYRRAAEQPDAPFYAARLHGEMLRRLGRNEEALHWFVALHRSLPPANGEADAPGVLARIRGLESELHIPSKEVYQPAP
jgi:tetratricopeptide (TPR) repeat protein